MQVSILSITISINLLFTLFALAQEKCGPNIGSCAPGDCCSLAGYCGTGSDYCASPDCQFQYGPACDANQVPSGANTSSISRGSLGSVLFGGDGIYNCAIPGDFALTFDDGPGPYTSHILDLLDQYNAKATFFITGISNGKGAIDSANLPWPAIIRRMHDSGHQIASHTWSHADLSKISPSERYNEMIKNEMAIRNILGFIPTYMRPPYSSCSTESGCADDMVKLGYHVTYFDLDTQDYLNDSPAQIGKSKAIVNDALQSKSSTNANFLSIMHDIHQQTSDQLVENILQSLTSKGFRPVTAGTCLGDPQVNWYRPDRRTLGFRRRY